MAPPLLEVDRERADRRVLIAMPDYGPGFWAHFAYGYALVAVATFLLARAVYRSSGVFRAQAAIMLFGVLLPWVVNIIDMSRVFGFIHVDSVAMAFGVTGLAFLPALFRYRLLDLTPVAWAAVVRGMDDAVIVIDRLRPDRGAEPGRRAAGRPEAARGPGVRGGRGSSTDGRRWPAGWTGSASTGEASFELIGPDRPAPRSSTPGSRGWAAARGVAGCVGSRRGRRRLGAAGWVLVLRDISASKRAEGERVRMLREQAARAEAEAANRAKDRFLATLSHELRTPLTPDPGHGHGDARAARHARADAPGDGDDPAQRQPGGPADRRPARPDPRPGRQAAPEARGGRRARADPSRRRDLPGRLCAGGAPVWSWTSPPAARRRRRPDPAPAGPVEPAEERDQVHPRGRDGDGPLPRRRGRRRRPSGPGGRRGC